MPPEDTGSPLVVNLSVLMNRPTGISTYAQNLLPLLKPFEPVVLSAQPVRGFSIRQIPKSLSPDYGSKAHLRRLCWLQRKVPAICQQIAPQATEEAPQRGASRQLLFSPLPEAPLYTRCRFIVTVHDMIPLRFPDAFPRVLIAYFRYYVAQVVSQAEHILCNSVATANDVQTFYQTAIDKLTVTPLAYDQAHFRPMDVPQSNYFLYVGRQNNHKNLLRLISAFAQVHQRHSGVELWLVGPSDPRYMSALVTLRTDLGLSECVRFLDYVDYEQLPALLSGAIALTFPSLWEGFGLPVLEAMACGTPVITSKLSSLPEVAGDAALLIDPYDVEQLASAMCRLLQEPSLRPHLSQSGLARAKEFSWQQTGQQTVAVLERFL